MFGYTPEEMMGRTLFSFMDEAGVGRGKELLGRRPQQTPEIQDLEFLRKDGQRVHTRVTTAPILDEQGRYAGAVAGVLDVTERFALERVVRDISEREQRRIGEDLHDGLGQMLTAIELSCSLLKQDLPSDLPDLQNQAAQMGERLREAIRQTRTLALGLTGFRLTSHGLCTALTELAQSISSLGRLRCRFDCPEPVSLHDPVIDIHLYRIAQEAVHNAVKHAQGSQVRICLTQAAGALRLQVSDDGTGLPGRSEAPNPGMGLQVMRHRASIIGAQLSVESSPGQGVTVTCLCQRGDAEAGSQTRDPSNES
jgi:PAS domain S-box-containing protein